MYDTNLTTLKADLCNVNWNSINDSLETNSKYETYFLKYYHNYIKTLCLEGFSKQKACRHHG